MRDAAMVFTQVSANGFLTSRTRGQMSHESLQQRMPFERQPEE